MQLKDLSVPSRRHTCPRRVRLAMLFMGWALTYVLIDDAAAARAGLGRTVRMEVTAYCPCTKCCGPNAQGLTASGKPVTHNKGRFVAADTRLLGFGTGLSIPGYYGGETVKVLDRGGAIKGNKLDVFFASHERALRWGRQHLDVMVLED